MEYAVPLKILLVEDSAEDALLLEGHLKSDGLDCDLVRVDSMAEFKAAMAKSGWDLVLVDYHLSGFTALDVLPEARRLAPDLPAIVLSRGLSEEAAMGVFHLGAKDLVNKERLARLAPAIRRELQERHKPSGTHPTTAEWIIGSTAAEALGSDLRTLGAPAPCHPWAQSELQNVRETGSSSTHGKTTNMDAIRKGGSEYATWFSLASEPNGPLRHAAGILPDICEWKANENSQFEYLQFLCTVLETIPSPLYYEDMEGRILGCNGAFGRFVGLPNPEVVGRKVVDLLPDAVEEGAEDVEPGFLVRPDALEIPFRMNLPDGRMCHALFRKAPFWDADGHPQGYVATLLDITRLKETEEALRRKESLFTAIHRHVVDLVAIIDAQGHRLYTSPSYQFILGYSEAEMVGLSSTDLLHAEDVKRVSQALEGIMKGRPSQRIEYRLRHKDGRWLHFESTASIIPDPDGEAIRALVVARDITERKASDLARAAMEVQLRQAQKLEAIGQLAAGIAHEINTPTQFIGDNITFLRDAFMDAFNLLNKVSDHLGASNPGAAKADLEAADLDYFRQEIPKAIRQSLEGVERISKIVKAMKDFSHPGGTSLTLTNLHHAIESTITVSRNEWKYAATLVTEFAPDLPLVPCYPGELNQVILNLIVNAAHAIEAAREVSEPEFMGQIIIKTRTGQNEVEVSVSDNGTGIPEAVQARMFEPFFTTKPVGKGSGQGLAIAHTVIVEKHRGRIEVASEVGRGTTFILHLPLQLQDQGEASHP